MQSTFLLFEIRIRAHSYLSFLRSPTGTGLTEIRGKVEMEPCD